MGSGNSGFFKNTKGALKPEHLLSELIKNDVKFMMCTHKTGHNI